jgi:predicted nucleotide-binding protein (sugar kinase/HSP70/actin superfamily)
VRRDDLSRQFLPDRLAAEGVAVRTAPVTEWIHYCDWCLEKGFASATLSLPGRAGHWAKTLVMRRHEERLQRKFVATGLVQDGHVSMSRVTGVAKRHMSPALTGEAFLTIGAAMTDVHERSSGVIAIGPFGCMPNRLAESILSKTMTDGESHPASAGDSPFLAVESDGLPFSQTIEANLETFVLRAKRAHEVILARGGYSSGGSDAKKFLSGATASALNFISGLFV